MKIPIILIGGGGHCRACIDVLEQEKKFQISGIVERNEGRIESVLGYPVIGTDKDLPKLYEQYQNALITIGQIRSAESRKRLFSQLKKLNFSLPQVISPRAYVSPNANIGMGTIVMHDSLVNAGSQVGENCILNTKSLIEHDVQVGDNCHIAPASVLNGEVQVGKDSFIGSGSVVREGIKIGLQSFVAGGTRVMRDLPPNSNYKNLL